MEQSDCSDNPSDCAPVIGTQHDWCMVLTIWGDKYGTAHVNELAGSAMRHSSKLVKVILLTDRIRLGIEPHISQTLFPDYFHRPDFFAGAYRAKLAMFSSTILPKNMRCVYVDLDTVVIGDLGKIADLVESPSDYFMMPPAGLGFGRFRKLVDWLKGGSSFPTGNSSLVAFHSAAQPNLSDTFQSMHAAGIDIGARYMQIDDLFISWFARKYLAAIPKSLAVTFRREYLSRSLLLLRIKTLLPWVRLRRASLVAITLNGNAYKPEILIALEDGAIMYDSKGRKGYWSDRFIGPARARIIASCRRIMAAR